MVRARCSSLVARLGCCEEHDFNLRLGILLVQTKLSIHFHKICIDLESALRRCLCLQKSMV
jgi:hypothetical protein